MPIFRSGQDVHYFAHIPKCAGSSVEDYLRARFGPLGFLDNRYMARPETERWTRTSPQHADWATIEQLFGADFFRASFAVVRHPLARAISAYHFQLGVEKTASAELSFGEWLETMRARQEQDPFVIDNHFRAQVEFLPPDCSIFHLEHGLDALVPYFDSLTGRQDGPRGVGHSNKKGAYRDAIPTRKVSPTSRELELISEIYARDFERLGYEVEQAHPSSPAPDISADILAEADRERRRAARPVNRLKARIRRRIRRWSES